MTCTQKHFIAIREAVRKAFFEARDSYLWYLKHEPDSPMVDYYCEKYEQYSVLRVMFAQATELTFTIK